MSKVEGGGSLMLESETRSESPDAFAMEVVAVGIFTDSEPIEVAGVSEDESGAFKQPPDESWSCPERLGCRPAFAAKIRAGSLLGLPHVIATNFRSFSTHLNRSHQTLLIDSIRISCFLRGSQSQSLEFRALASLYWIIPDHGAEQKGGPKYSVPPDKTQSS